MKRLAPAVALVAALLTGASAQALRLPAARNCPVFPATSAWYQRVDRLPGAAGSGAEAEAASEACPARRDRRSCRSR